MAQPRLIVCRMHHPGGAANPYCYVQRDGSHLPKSACTCHNSTAKRPCPVDLHQAPASDEGATTGNSSSP